MLKVKAPSFSIQGTGQVFSFKKGDIVADEIFVKEFPDNGSGKIILRGLLEEGILEDTEKAPRAQNKDKEKGAKDDK